MSGDHIGAAVTKKGQTFRDRRRLARHFYRHIYATSSRQVIYYSFPFGLRIRGQRQDDVCAEPAREIETQQR